MTGSAVSEPDARGVAHLGGALEQARVQIEHVARIGLAARRAAQQQRHLAVGDGLLGQIVIDDHGVHAVVAEVFAHGAAGERRQELHRRRIGRGGGDDDRVFQRALLLQHLDELRDGRALLADRDIDAVQLDLLVGLRVERLLVEDGVERDRGLAGLAVADDQLALAAADRDERVDRLQPRRHRLVHRLARNDAGRLDVDAHALVGLDRALAVDRIAERVDDAAEQALADRHVDDGAGALDGLAFLDLAVVAEDHDADVVDFEVERHAADAVLELDHLAGLHVVEAVDAGDAVADRQHLADFGDFRLLAEILDLVLQDRGDFCGADIHQPASFIACLIALSLVRSEAIDHAGAELDDQPADDRRIDLDVEIDRLLAGDRFERALDRLEMGVGQLLGGGDLGGHLALPARDELAEVADHLADREQPAVRGHEHQEVRGEPADAGLGEHGGERPAPLLGAEHRAADQAIEVRALRDHGGEFFDIGLHRVDGLGVERELEQRARIAARHAGYGRIFACHVRALLKSNPQVRRRPPWRGTNPWISREFSDFGSRRQPREKRAVP